MKKNSNQKKEDIEIISPKEITIENMCGATTSNLDANHRVQLLQLADDVFRKDLSAEKRFTLEVREGMNAIIAAGIIAAIADEAVHGDSTFSIVLKNNMYPQLIVAAKDMGITLPNIKALPQIENEKINIKSTEIKVSKEATEKINEEREVTETVPELDPEKIANMSENDLVKAITYILITGPKIGKSIKDTLIKIVDFMYKYRMALADKSENSAEAKLKYDSYTTEDWLNEAFNYVTPTFLIHGIGRGLISTIGLEKSPITAFCVLRKSFTNKEGIVEWDDESIAYATKAIVRFVANEIICKEKTNMNNLDKKDKNYEDNVNNHKSAINHYIEILNDLTNCDPEIIRTLISKTENKDITAMKIFDRIKEQYYPTKTTMFKNMNYNIEQLAGYIINLFRDKGSKLIDYSKDNIKNLEPFTPEEIKEMQKTGGEKKSKKNDSDSSTEKDKTEKDKTEKDETENKKQNKKQNKLKK